MKKVFGIFLIIIGVLLALALIGRFGSFLSSIIKVGQLFSSELQAEQVGRILGGLLYWTVHITIMYFSFRLGPKWMKNK